jgi:hypothetical protein
MTVNAGGDDDRWARFWRFVNILRIAADLADWLDQLLGGGGFGPRL